MRDFIITIAVAVAIKNTITIAFTVDFDFDFTFANTVPITVDFAVAVAVAVAVNFVVTINFFVLAWLPVRTRSYAFPGTLKVDSIKKVTINCIIVP